MTAPPASLPDGPIDSRPGEEAQVRQNRALELRMAGATFEQIAKAVGYASAGAAHTAVQHALRRDNERVSEVRDEYRALSLARTDRLIRGIWTTAIGGDVQAIDRVNRLMERQARLLGLDAPTQVMITDETRETILAMVEQLEVETDPGDIYEITDLPESPAQPPNGE